MIKGLLAMELASLGHRQKMTHDQLWATKASGGTTKLAQDENSALRGEFIGSELKWESRGTLMKEIREQTALL